jgi:hypothetical protein
VFAPRAVLDAVVAWQRFERDRTTRFAAEGRWPWSEIMARDGEVERFDSDIAWLAGAYREIRAKLPEH